MWKFKTTKYKNSAPKIPKKEQWITKLPIGNLMQSAGNHIAASCTFMAFNTGAGCLGILPVNTTGKQDQHVPILYGHGDFLSDFNFSPVNDGLLATGSFDCSVKIWNLGESVTENISNAASMLPHFHSRVENVLWNPVVEGVLAVNSGPAISVFDVECNQEIYALDNHGDHIQGLTWKQDGSLMATTCKDKMIRVFDPRAPQPKIQEGNGHQNIKDSRIAWLGNSNQILSSGFSEQRSREICVWDYSNLSKPLSRRDIDTATSVLMPLYDPDSRMMFLAGKGDTAMRFCEVTDNSPYLTDGASDNLMQMKGACLIPKRVVDVMSGEVNRVLLLTKDTIVPCPYIVPRKNYHDFHADIFPDTFSGEPAMTTQEWFSGVNKPFTTVSLNPANAAKKIKPSRPLLVNNAASSAPGQPIKQENGGSGEPQEPVAMVTEPVVESPKPANIETKAIFLEPEVLTRTTCEPPRNTAEPPVVSRPAEAPTTLDLSSNVDHDASTKVSTLNIGSPEARKGFGRMRAFSTDEDEFVPTTNENSAPQSASHTKIKVGSDHVPVAMRAKKPAFKGVRVSKFRHLKGTLLHKSNNIENIRNLSNRMPGESDVFHINKHRCAVPLKGAGGLIGIYEFSKPGRLSDTDVPYIQNGSSVYDLTWDPFNTCRLATCCEDGSIKVWEVPEGGLTEVLTEPVMDLRGHNDKLYFTKFHPLARDVLVSASHDLQLIVWNLETESAEITCTGHTNTIFCLCWSQDGSKFATVCKDGKVRMYDPRKSTEPIQEGPGPQGTRGARILWALDDKYLVVSGFDRESRRMLFVYRADDLSSKVGSAEIDISPAILIPFYDHDSATIFLTGRGDGNVHAFEISEESPHLFQLSSYSGDGLHQALSFLPKSEINVRIVEFAKAYRLTKTSVEPISFTVPRIKAGYFQDDLFPPTKVTWEPTMTADEWFAGSNKQAPRVSLKPTDMENLTKAPAEVPRASKYESYNVETYKTDSEKKEELVGAMMGKLEDKTGKPLPQDLTEGVDEDEWDD